MRPTWQSDDGTVQLFLGDCLEILPQLEAGSVDAVVTDPPFGLPGETVDARDAVLDMQIVPVSLVFADWRNPIKHPMKFGELIWEYGWISGGRSRATTGAPPTHNTIHLLGDSSLVSFTTGSIIARRPGFSSPRQCSFAKKTGHPFEKPIALMQWLLGGVRSVSVMDPFMGSCSTGEACIRLGRRFIGMEIDTHYFWDICVPRCQAALAERDPNARIPTQPLDAGFMSLFSNRKED